MSHVIVGTAGHIDHGKTALVKALTGIDADRLKEEKERGITIDIGFAALELGPGVTIGFIDVPGHERFVKNMLAGVGGIDAVMLVVAADESVMPQTREHLNICSLLRISDGLTVITKSDAVHPELVELVEMELKDFLKPTFLAGKPILCVSSRTGEGVDRLRSALGQLAARVRPRDATRIFRLPIDRCFTMRGFGTVVTGTLISGQVSREDEVEILPLEETARVRGIQVHGRSTDAVRAGQRAALNLQGVEVDEVVRGMVLTPPGLFKPTSMLDCELELLPGAPRPIESRKRVRFHVGTAEIMAYVALLGCDRLEPGASALAQVRLEAPAFALPGDRFIIRQYSPMTTIGGGQILDSYPVRHRRRDAAVIEALDLLRDGGIRDRLRFLVSRAGLGSSGLVQLVGRVGLPPAVIRDELDALARAGEVRRLSDDPLWVISAPAFEGARSSVMASIRGFHQANPLLEGISREELRTRIFRHAPAAAFQAVIDDLIRDRQVAVVQDVIHKYGRKVTLGADEERIRRRLSERFLSLGLEAPSPDELIGSLKLDRSTARKIIRLMVREGELVRISEEMILHRGAIDSVIGQLRRSRDKNSRLSVGEFKELAGVSRKYAIPLLEYLDRQSVTRRLGDERLIL